LRGCSLRGSHISQTRIWKFSCRSQSERRLLDAPARSDEIRHTSRDLTKQAQEAPTDTAFTLADLTVGGQRFNLVLGQCAPSTLGQIAQSQLADAHTHQAQHGNVKGAQQAAYLPVAPFVERNFKPRILLAAAQAALEGS